MAFAATKTGAKKCPVKGIFWHSPSRQYLSHIGYNERPIGDDNPKKLRATQYLGRDEAQAIIKYIAVKNQWKQLVERKRQDRQQLIELDLPITPFMNVYWPKKGEEDTTLRPITERLQQVCDDFQASEHPGKPHITIADAAKAFIQKRYKDRVGLKGTQGLKQRSADSAELNLRLAMAKASKAKPEDQRIPIDPSRSIHSLKKQDLEDFKNYWWRGDLEISERSAINYCSTFKVFLDWMAGEEEYQWDKPKGTDEIFRFKNSTPAYIAKYDATKIKNLLNGGSELAKMYQLMAMNFGFYQVDVSLLRTENVVYRDNQMYVRCRRAKTSHQNDFDTEWSVWPETQKLMEKYHTNGDYYFGNGKPLNFHTIRKAFDVARVNSKVTGISFKQFRKIGVSKIKRITGNPDIARMYAAHKISGVMARYDRDDFFEPMHNALKKWREELIADGVLA